MKKNDKEKNAELKMINNTTMDKEFYRDVVSFRIWRDNVFKLLAFVMTVIIYFACRAMAENPDDKVAWCITICCWVFFPIIMFPVRKAILRNRYYKQLDTDGVTERKQTVEFNNGNITVRVDGKKQVIGVRTVKSYTKTNNIWSICYEPYEYIYMRQSGFNCLAEDVENYLKMIVEKNKKENTGK